MPRLRFLLLIALLSALLLAQSRPIGNLDQPSGVPKGISLVLQESNFLQGTTSVHKATVRRAHSPATSKVTFGPAVTYNSGGEFASYVTAADVNGDGRTDVVVSNCGPLTGGNGCSSSVQGVIGVLLGRGDGTFQEAVSYGSGGFEPASVAAVDVNGDGKADLLVLNRFGDSHPGTHGTVGVLLGNGDGTFQTSVTYDVGVYGPSTALAVQDVNGDGRPDLLVANLCPDGFCTNYSTVSVLLGNGDGTFGKPTQYSSGGFDAYGVAVADVNSDGKPDLLVINSCGNDNTCDLHGTVGVLLGNGDGSFQTAVAYDSGDYSAVSVAVADVNGDGNPDILVVNECAGSNVCPTGSAGVLLGNGDGTFQSATTYDSDGQLPNSIATVDINGDGKPDLVVANKCASSGCPSDTGVIGVLLGNGDGTFQQALAYGSGGYVANGVMAADVNGDGKPDLLVANQCANASCITGAAGVLINMIPTSTTLVSSLNPSSFGQIVTFSATVTPGTSGATPTGTMTFYDGATNIGVSTLNSSGVATLGISTLAVGSHSITASYSGDGSFASSTSPALSQVVQGAVAVLSTSSLNFGNQTVGISSTVQAVTLTNSGNILLTLAVNLVGTNVGDFSQANNCGSSIPAGGSCTISVTFTPTMTGTRSAAVSITDNAPNSPQSISVGGVGVTPTVQLSPTTLTFSTQVVFTASTAQSVVLTNTGLGVLAIKAGGISGQFGVTTNCGGTVNPGANCTINVTFRPKTIGLLTGSISVKDNAPDSPQKIGLSGTGTSIQLNPTSVNFGNQPVGTKSLIKKITLSNKSSVSVSITGITITGTNASDFAQTNNCGTSVAAGASCFIGVTFTPSAKGARSATISVRDSGGGSPQQVQLKGAGT